MKNTKMKKFLVVVLSAALVAGLAAGCGSKEDGKEEDKGSSAKTAKVIDVDLTNEEYAFGIDKDQPELVEQVNAFIKEVKEEQIRYEYVLFVDSSIRMISKNWMREMIGICQFPENGVVGIQLINKKNQTIYHNGFLKGQKGYAFQGQPVEAVGYFHRDELTQCVDGVTDKFMMMRTEQLSTELLKKYGKDIIVEKGNGKFIVDPQIKAYFNI